MSEQKPISDTALFESALDREERHIKRILLVLVFVIACWITTIALFMWYISLPVEDTTITQESDNDSYNQIIGGDYNGIETDSSEGEESLEK